MRGRKRTLALHSLVSAVYFSLSVYFIYLGIARCIENSWWFALADAVVAIVYALLFGEMCDRIIELRRAC